MNINTTTPAVQHSPSPLGLVLALFLSLLAFAAPVAAEPVVSNVRAAQLAGTHRVLIHYHLSNPSGEPVTVNVQVSNNGGEDWFEALPGSAFSGAVGPNVSPGQDKEITFFPAQVPELAETFSKQVRFRVNAITGDGSGGGELDGFARIPAGQFTMGRTSGDTDSNAPPVSVYVSEFYMARHQVTWELWNEVRNWAVNNGYTDIATGGGKAATHPVHSVNWWDVVKWCNARSEREGLTPVYRNADGTVFKIGTIAPTPNWNANGYRLPTEAEWEKAARGGVSGQRFPWGDEITHSQANYWSSSNYGYDTSPTRGYHPAYNDGTTPYTAPVGSFAPNGYGLYDMAGNVWEWCWDWYSASTYEDGASDPKGPASGSSRVLRGGSWFNDAFSCRSAIRNGSLPGSRNINNGFRPARSSVP